MMLPIPLGGDNETGQKVFADPESFRTHYHLVGATGVGKTTAMHALLRPLMKEPANPVCLFVIDKMGNLSHDLLRWMVSNPRLEHVRERLLYIEPAREEHVLPFNPLHYTSEANLYYQVARAVDLILRAWRSQDVMQQPRLLQWSFKALCAVATLGYPVAMSRYLLHPGSDEHDALLSQLPDEIRYQWLEILNARGSEATKILESTRNRFDPFHKSVILSRMFGVSENRFDVERFIRERRIVIVNLAKYGNLPSHLGATIGSLIANEIFETVYNMATVHGREAVDPTYLLMDEFQHFVGPDIEDALPTVRQMGLRLILAHQSFSQLEQGDIDLTPMIWQARSRLMFANNAMDADIIADELAKVTFDPMAVKDQRSTVRQMITGYRKEWLNSIGASSTRADSVINNQSVGYGRSTGESTRIGAGTFGRNANTTSSHGSVSGNTHADSESESRNRSESLVPIHKTFEEVSSITYKSFDEHRLMWSRVIRELRTGECFARFVNDPRLYHLLVNYEPVRETPRIDAAVKELLQRNFEQDCFISAARADQLADVERRALLSPPAIVIPAQNDQSPAVIEADVQPSVPEDNPYRKSARKR